MAKAQRFAPRTQLWQLIPTASTPTSSTLLERSWFPSQYSNRQRRLRLCSAQRYSIIYRILDFSSKFRVHNRIRANNCHSWLRGITTSSAPSVPLRQFPLFKTPRQQWLRQTEGQSERRYVTVRWNAWAKIEIYRSPGSRSVNNEKIKSYAEMLTNDRDPAWLVICNSLQFIRWQSAMSRLWIDAPLRACVYSPVFLSLPTIHSFHYNAVVTCEIKLF